MKTIFSVIFFVIITMLTSCEYFSYISQQKQYKKEFQNEIIFVDSLISNPNIMDSLILKSDYYESTYYELIKHQVKSAKSSFLYNMNNKCIPKIFNVYVGDNYKLNKKININSYLGIMVNEGCKIETKRFFGFVFSKINGKFKLIDIYEVNTN